MNAEEITIYFGSRKFMLRDLLQQDATSFSQNERAVIDLCRKWTRGDEHFEVSTSGSTGVPKVITFHRDQMRMSARLTAEALALRPGMNALLCLDPNFIAGKMMVIRCLVIGMDLIVINPVANPLDHLPSESGTIDFAAMVPLQVATATASPRSSELNKFVKIIIGGARVDAALQAQLAGFDTEFYSTFGMTETISHVALRRLNGTGQTDHMQALPGVRFSVDDRDCLVIQAQFHEQPLVTNDVVELIDDQGFKWLGRFDNVINSGGIKVMPETLEPAIQIVLKELNIDSSFFVCGDNHPLLGQEVVLVLEGRIADEGMLLSTLKERLPKYSSPRRVLYADKFLFTSTGKIKRDETVSAASPRPGV